jgi:hypothetical protein
MKKLIIWAAWASGAIGAVLMLLGVIARLAGGIMWNHMWSNYFYPGTCFIVLGIFLFLGAATCSGKEG